MKKLSEISHLGHLAFKVGFDKETKIYHLPRCFNENVSIRSMDQLTSKDWKPCKECLRDNNTDEASAALTKMPFGRTYFQAKRLLDFISKEEKYQKKVKKISLDSLAAYSSVMSAAENLSTYASSDFKVRTFTTEFIAKNSELFAEALMRNNCQMLVEMLLLEKVGELTGAKSAKKDKLLRQLSFEISHDAKPVYIYIEHTFGQIAGFGTKDFSAALRTLAHVNLRQVFKVPDVVAEAFRSEGFVNELSFSQPPEDFSDLQLLTLNSLIAKGMPLKAALMASFKL